MIGLMVRDTTAGTVVSAFFNAGEIIKSSVNITIVQVLHLANAQEEPNVHSQELQLLALEPRNERKFEHWVLQMNNSFVSSQIVYYLNI